MAEPSYYPPNPPEVPEDFAAPSSPYKTRKVVVLLTLALFFLLYFGVMFFCGIYVCLAIFHCPVEPPLLRLIAMILSAPAGVLGLYLFKNLLKDERIQKEFLIEIFEEEHPRLFDFIHRVCADAGAQRPIHVYVDYNVNAAARSDVSSLLHLCIPPGNSLIIGLGLVNCLNLTEFKSVMAHEFGHFTQKGTRTNTFIVKAFAIMNKIVNSEDGMDRFVVQCSQSNSFIAALALLPRGIRWLLRQALVTMSYTIASAVVAHRRQSELHADQVARGLTGSDAVVHYHCRLRFGSESLGQAIDDLRLAMTHRLYTADLFHHQAAAAHFLRIKKKDPRLGEPPPLPDDPTRTTQVFEDDGDKIAEQWSDHPSPYEIERHVKANYLRSAFDERSPWLLFDNVEALRERVTCKFYRFYFNAPKEIILAKPEEVQRFIDDEHAERTYDPRYQGMYDKRALILKQPCKITELAEAHPTLYSTECDRNDRWLKSLDRQVFMTYFQMALHSNPEIAEELYRRYEFHLELERIWIELQKQKRPIRGAIGFLNVRSFDRMRRHEFQELLDIFRRAHKALEMMLRTSEEMILPALKNMPAGQPLRPFLLARDLVDGLSRDEQRISNRWIMRLLDQFNEMHAKSERMHCKSLAAILALQEKIGAECVRRWTNQPAEKSVGA